MIRTETGIAGQTNVTSARFGRGASLGLGRELGRFAVCTMAAPWEAARHRLGGQPAEVCFVESMELDVLNRQLDALPPVDTMVGAGGGQAVDMAKYFAWKRGLRLVTIPTVLSVDAFVTPAAGVRVNHRVEYLGAASPDPLVVDYDLLRTAPRELNVAGAGDLLSIHTACFDWELSARDGMDTHGFDPVVIAKARAILAGIEQSAEEIARATDAGLQALVDGYLLVNTLCLPAGHYRVEEGSEHFLFYGLEERLQRPFPHGQIVGLGIALMSRLQENRPAWITGLMDRLGLDYHPAALGIPQDALAASLLNLREFVQQRGHWYSVIQTREITPEWVSAALNELRF